MEGWRDEGKGSLILGFATVGKKECWNEQQQPWRTCMTMPVLFVLVTCSILGSPLPVGCLDSMGHWFSGPALAEPPKGVFIQNIWKASLWIKLLSFFASHMPLQVKSDETLNMFLEDRVKVYLPQYTISLNHTFCDMFWFMMGPWKGKTGLIWWGMHLWGNSPEGEETASAGCLVWF